MAKKKDDELTVNKADADLKRAYRAKKSLIDREKKDFLFALGDQWSDEDKSSLEKAGIKPVTDNRIAPNLFLLTGLERQNRTDFKAFPEGEEDGLKAEIASTLFKDAIKKSDYSYKSSEQFKDGITCGESHMELYLDYTDSLLNGKPCWKKSDGSTLLADPDAREYDLSDAAFIYKLTLGIAEGDLINLFPDKKKQIDDAEGGKINIGSLLGAEEKHTQHRDYPSKGGDTSIGSGAADDEDCFDLVERYYKKWVSRTFVGDKQTGVIKQSETPEKADSFISEYQGGIEKDKALFEQTMAGMMQQHDAMNPAMAAAPMEQKLAGIEASGVKLPPPPPEQNPDRFIVIKRMVPEIWYFAYVPGMDSPLADERAWFFPKWKSYPFIPYFARFSTAPLTGEERHLLVQGIVHGVKGSQEKHNKAEMLMLRHLNSATNSGWLAEEDVWVDPEKVKNFGSTPGINLEYKAGKQKPERIFPMALSQGHAQVAADSAESIKAQLGINADLLAASQGGTDSGRAIALRQKQGLLMVQELFDNLSRTRQRAGRFLLSQLGEVYDVESAKKVMGDAWLRKNFPVVMLANTMDPMAPQEPMKDQFGKPMEYDKDLADLAMTEVLGGELETYDVYVGEAVASETQKMSISAEMKDFSTAFPGMIPPDVMVRHSQLPESAKTEIITAIEKQMMAQQQMAAQQTQGGRQGSFPPGQ
jgi:hypothetical protein